MLLRPKRLLILETHRPVPARGAREVGTILRLKLHQHLTTDSFALIGMFIACSPILPPLSKPHLVSVFGAKVEQRQSIRLTQRIARVRSVKIAALSIDQSQLTRTARLLNPPLGGPLETARSTIIA